MTELESTSRKNRIAVPLFSVTILSVCPELYSAICAIAPSTPATTLIAKTGARYSVCQSASEAKTLTEALAAQALGHPRSSTPAAANASAMGGSNAIAASSTSRVSKVLQVP